MIKINNPLLHNLFGDRWNDVVNSVIQKNRSMFRQIIEEIGGIGKIDLDELFDALAVKAMVDFPGQFVKTCFICGESLESPRYSTYLGEKVCNDCIIKYMDDAVQTRRDEMSEKLMMMFGV